MRDLSLIDNVVLTRQYLLTIAYSIAEKNSLTLEVNTNALATDPGQRNPVLGRHFMRIKAVSWFAFDALQKSNSFLYYWVHLDRIPN